MKYFKFAKVKRCENENIPLCTQYLAYCNVACIAESFNYIIFIINIIIFISFNESKNSDIF